MHVTAGLVVVIAIALAFDFFNGFHDAANSIATVVSTRVLTPVARRAVGRVLQLHRVHVLRDEGRRDDREGRRRPGVPDAVGDLRRA